MSTNLTELREISKVKDAQLLVVLLSLSQLRDATVTVTVVITKYEGEPKLAYNFVLKW